MHRNSVLLAATIAAITASPGFACERDAAPIFRLPGETDHSAMVRAEQIRTDGALLDRIETEKRYLHLAKIIYVGRIESRFEDDRGTIVKPLRAYRGALPVSSKTLVWVPGSLCGGEISDGEGWRGKPGELVVIFEGLDHSMWRPNGIDSLLATSIRSPELLHWIEQLGTIVDTDDSE